MIGENIKKYRIEAGLTQEQLAVAIGYKQSTVNKWENNSLMMYAITLKAIANALNVDIAKLYE